MIKKIIIRTAKNELIKDSFWSLFGNVFSKGLSLFSGIFIARLLGKEVFGEYGMIKNTLVSIALFSTFGFGYAVTKFIAEYRDSNTKKLKVIIGYVTSITVIVSFLMSFLVFVFSDYIAVDILKSEGLSSSLRIVAILILLNAIVSLQLGVLYGLGKFKEIARINVIVGVVTFVFSVLFTYLWKLNGALLALLLVQLVNFILNYQLIGDFNCFFVKREERDKIIFNEIINFSVPVALQEALFSAVYWFSNLLIVNYSSYGELGLYNATLQWTSMILFIPGVLRSVVLSHLSTKLNNEKEFAKVISLTLLINFIMTLIPALGVLLLSNFIADFYGDSFVGFASLVRIALISTLFISTSNIFVQIYMSKGKNWLMFFLKSFRDVGGIAAFLFFFNLKNINSGAEAMIYSVLFINIIFMLLVIGFYNSSLFKK
ncbi:oligosaccharide flippase family protein [uncultured Tenacibaculum sp.]|uniref:oligosaccharide flippase family protein n=1 Tax=uncultured Tenacibaculum sp. TaxID=174713 RepID=UPI0026311FC8|nr:oligosaccharide flippase family protein [uncultured Tenacibaculum sp.]